MATAQLALIAKDFQIADVPVSLVGITLPALTFALSIDRILNGVTRPFFGWVSDNIGRDRKSTRLNSSHPSISYAVFCLKKKKISSRHNLPCPPAALRVS